MIFTFSRKASFYCFVSVAFFILSIVTISYILTKYSPSVLVIPQYRAKMDLYNDYEKKIDVLFVGNSRVDTGIRPSTFDNLMDKSGHHMTSFNFGLNGATFGEIVFLINQLQRSSNGLPEWVVVGIDFHKSNYPKTQMNTIKGMYWHDLKATSIILATGYEYQAQEDSKSGRVEYLQHSKDFISRFFLQGQGWNIVQGMFIVDADHKKPFEVEIEKQKRRLEKGGHRKRFGVIPEEQMQRWQQLIGRYRTETEFKMEFGADEVYLRNLTLEIERLGSKAVYMVIPPGVNWSMALNINECIETPTIYLNDGRESPWLFDITNWHDPVHLNTEGATKITRLLVDKFLKII